MLHYPQRGVTPMTTEAAKIAKAKYDARTARYVSLKLNINTDSDIIQLLEQAENKQALIKQALREYKKKTGK